MKIRVNKGTIGRRNHIRSGVEGFNMLFPGEYGAELSPANQMTIFKGNGEKSFLSISQLEDKISKGVITILYS
jgi:hypothetical protein